MRDLGHNLYTDGLIDRNDMISLLRNAEDGSVVDSTELTDLRAITSNTTLFGSLRLCLEAFQLRRERQHGERKIPRHHARKSGRWLVVGRKWRNSSTNGSWASTVPTAGGAYRQFAGQLFVSGATYSDIHQGNLGDCYFMASLGEVALKNQAAITNMFIVNGDGTYTVRFFHNSVAEYVTVDSYLPTNTRRLDLLYANRGATYSQLQQRIVDRAGREGLRSDERNGLDPR